MWLEPELYEKLKCPIPEDWNLKDFIAIDLQNEDDFLKIKETLSRIGVVGKDNTLYQSAHILHKQGVYYIVHFKEMFILDGRDNNMTLEDYIRVGYIESLISSWFECSDPTYAGSRFSDSLDEDYIKEHLMGPCSIQDAEDFERLKRFVSNKTMILKHSEKKN